ncbi:pyridoxal phosphate-dependent transferase [Gamsiella multidivaricata]|uniref:pyridoxal phosphate-dependent transferase n=1 Tax=Gamsiella multidivaricata TaxID=101098 RepID=UPI00221E477E|nr:pyridoxal phosphate-dependent transferase [Gamsiella multidivaricata]KAG0364213.1 Aromatic/aminoadipate aminotransferase 1 [Gamsiella multidivaricata]KAI7817109.1 pyridoxal phosphate-dependent transferase [Gamsiella multidivaricata]
MPSILKTTELPMAKDFSSFLSIEGASRKKSPFNGLLRLMGGDIVSLGSGLPHPSTFPFYSLSAEVKRIDPAIKATKPIATGAKSQAMVDLVTVPHGPQPGKVESLTDSLQYGLGSGIESLRMFCKEHVNQMHRPQYQDWDVVLSAGNTDAFAKAISMLCNRGDRVLVEEWTYPAALEMMEPLGVGHVPVKMDGEGMSAVALKDLLDNWGSTPEQASEAKPRVVYLIPTGQNPTGATMSIQRRRDIIQVAQQHNLILIEDDPYYYLQFGGDDEKSGNDTDGSESGWMPSLPSLLSLDTDARVIRLDTFSKTLAPGCRVGYMSANAQFCAIVQYHNEVSTQQPSGFSQAILAEMLISHWGQKGYIRYLCENVRTEYLKRSQHLQACYRKHVNPRLASFIKPSAGMFIWIKIHVEHHPKYGTVSDSALMLELFKKCVGNNVLMVPGWQFSCKPKPADIDPADLLNVWLDDRATYFRATFAYASFEQMDQAMVRFGESLNEVFGV